jgi:preprotein translocase subunit SecA
MQKGEAIESRMVTRRIEGAQKKVEERNFEIRKNLLEYDEVMDEQRKRVYSYRQKILDGVICKDLILDMIDRQVRHHFGEFLARDYRLEVYAEWAGKRLATQLEPRDFRGLDAAAAEQEAKDAAEQAAAAAVIEAVEENLPEDEDPSEWNWEALAKFANTRWGTNYRDRDLKRIGRDEIEQTLLDKANETIAKIDLSEGARFLDEEFGVRTACAWMRHKFGIELDFDEVHLLEPEALVELAKEKAQAAYDDKEAEYPVMAGLYRFSARTPSGPGRLDREALVAWAQQRFDVDFDLDDLKSKQREDIHALLVEHSRSHQRQADEMLKTAVQKVDELFGEGKSGMTARLAVGGTDGPLKELADWAGAELGSTLTPEDLAPLEQHELEMKICNAVEDRYRPEIRRMERILLLQLVDSAWKDHLLAMDHLRSAVSFVGYAQVDPKVEYKREGMKKFEAMWVSISERTTDLVFRMETLDEGFVSSTWVETAAVHEEAPGTSEIARQQQAAIDASGSGDKKPEPIRRRGKKVGRNDPCPCGSGKKYKSCCMRKRGAA